MAQSVAGKWYNSDYSITMILNEDASYELYNAQNALTESGQFGIQQQYFLLQSAQTGLTTTYQILGYDGKQFNFFDPSSNVQFNFQRQQAATQPLSDVGGRSLATKDGIELKQGHVDVYVRMMEFVVGQSLSTSDKSNIQRTCLEGFNENPAVQIQDAMSVRNSMSQIYALTDIGQISTARLMFISEFHKNWGQIQSTELGRLLKKYAPVETYDANTGLALTRKDLDGFIDFIDFMNSTVGGAQGMSMADKNSYKKQIVQNFATIGQEQQASVCMGSLLNNVMRENWKNMSYQQREQLKQQLLGQPAYSYTPPETYNEDNWMSGFEDNNWKPSPELEALRNKVNNGTATDADFVNYKAELDAQNMFFQTMNNMNTMSHVTSLNIIENMGGTGNYWETVDYNTGW
jgi:hypothetical protein